MVVVLNIKDTQSIEKPRLKICLPFLLEEGRNIVFRAGEPRYRILLIVVGQLIKKRFFLRFLNYSLVGVTKRRVFGSNLLHIAGPDSPRFYNLD